MFLGYPGKPLRRDVQRLVPACLAKMRERIRGVDIKTFWQSWLPDQRLHQSLWILYIVEAESAFDAQAILIGVAVAALHEGDRVVLDLIADLAAYTAIGTDRVDLAIHFAAAMLGDRIDDRFRHERAGGTGLHAFPARNASGQPHGIVEVEHRLGVDIAEGHSDHVIDLDLAASAHAESTVDAGVEVDRHGGMRQVGLQNAMGRKAGGVEPLNVCPMPEGGDPV